MGSDPVASRYSRTVERITFVVSLATILFIGIDHASGDRNTLPAYIALLTALFIALWINRRGLDRLAARIVAFAVFPLPVWMVLHSRDGLHSIVLLVFPALLILSVMLLDEISYKVLAACVLLGVAAIGWADLNNAIPSLSSQRTPVNIYTVLSVEIILMATGFIGTLIVRDSRKNLKEISAAVQRLASANEQLGQSEERYRSLIELAVDAIFITDAEGIILEVNRQACILMGRPRQELLATSLSALFLPAGPEVPPLSISALNHAEAVAGRCRIQQQSGVFRDAEWRSMAMSEGRIQCFCRDITDRIQTEQELAQLQKMDGIGRLAGGVAHDFNNLLTVINGYTDLLLMRSAKGEPSHEHLDQIRQAGERAAQLTRQLLAFSRKQPVRPVPTNWNRIVGESAGMLRSLIGEDIDLVIELDPSLKDVTADPSQMQQVLMNLAANARDAMPSGGQLRIETRDLSDASSPVSTMDCLRGGNQVLLKVSDNGLGMSEEVRQHLFEPFFTTKETGKGTGLGLATVYGIIRNYRGWIDVSTTLGQGTSFQIYLPALTASGERVSLADAMPAPRGGETILVVEDQQEVRQFAAEVMRHYGYRVFEASSGPDALRIMAQSGVRFHLMLTDVIMPGMNGNELAKHVRSAHPNTKILFTSGYPAEVMGNRGALEPRQNYLPKPFAPDELAAKVRQALMEMR